MLNALLSTDGGATALVLRLMFAVAIWPHGAQKLLGWFGGYGFGGTMGYFRSLGIPAPLGLLAILVEFAGPLALVLGFQTRLVALALGIVMLVAALRVHLPNGFFIDWAGTQPGQGIEYQLLAVTIAVALVILGGGAWSVDGALSRAVRG